MGIQASPVISRATSTRATALPIRRRVVEQPGAILTPSKSALGPVFRGAADQLIWPRARSRVERMPGHEGR